MIGRGINKWGVGWPLCKLCVNLMIMFDALTLGSANKVWLGEYIDFSVVSLT